MSFPSTILTITEVLMASRSLETPDLFAWWRDSSIWRPHRNLKLRRYKTIIFTPFVLLFFPFSFCWWMATPRTQLHKLETWVSSYDSSVLNLSPSCADSFSKHISLFFFTLIFLFLLPFFQYRVLWSFSLVSLSLFSSPFIAVIYLFGFTVISFCFCWQVHILCALACVTAGLASLVSCLDSAYLCSLVLCALRFLGNAKSFYSRVPYRSCHYGELLFIRKVQYEWHHLYEFFPAYPLWAKVSFSGLPNALSAPLLPLVVSCSDCVCLCVLSAFLHRTLFSPSLYS